jgi:phospholipid-binding lipoprotein MlaA
MGENLGRFVINTTLGLGGIFDVAGAMDSRRANTDVGLTLATHGVSSGPYVFHVMPSNVRDTTGSVASWALDPTTYLLPLNLAMYVGLGVGYFNRYAQNIHVLEQAEKMALDPYDGMRVMWTQMRAHRVDETRARVGRPPLARPSAKTADDLFDDMDDD